MGLFSKNGSSKEVPAPPPIFKTLEEDEALLKAQRPTKTGRRASLGVSSPCLGLNRHQSMPSVNGHQSMPRVTRRRSSVDVTIPSFSKPLNESKTAEVKVQKPLWKKLDRSTSNESGTESYIEEIVDEVSYDEEEIIFDDEYYEEEIIEEVIENVQLPEVESTIRFSEFDEMQTTLHINDYTAGEIEKSWYSRPDYDRMLEKARSAVTKMEKKETKKPKKRRDDEKGKEVGPGKKEKRKSVKDSGSDKSDDGKKKKKVDTRGLEGWSTAGSLEVRQLKEMALEAVWDEQIRQWNSGQRDAEKLREVYLTVSVGAQATAETRGAEDAAVVEKLHIKEKVQMKKDRRRLMKKSKSIFGKPNSGKKKGLINKAKKKVKKAVNSKKKDKSEPDKRQIYKQASQFSQLKLENLDDSLDQSFSLDELGKSSGNISRSDRLSRMPKTKSASSRTPSWESSLASGKY